ncbi:cobalt-precorrin-6A reductase [Prosthecomicrobium sp. N25]|uniref:cobalt-precorrin-6A reductase n=1 Tax=Prosthecomicrobium sp. N25 TaxID=3129254 RepID=UPI0030769CCE
MKPLRVLVLGGTTEAGLLARRLAGDPRFDATLSLAGRTREPAAQALPVRIGGFGGAAGLARHLAAEGIGALVDATHPFAARMSAHAAEAARAARVPLAAFSRVPWQAVDGDQWTEVPDNSAAAAALGPAPRRVLLTIGRLGVADFRAAGQHHYVVRTIDAPDPAEMPAQADLLLDRGPFDLAAEIRLLQDRRIDVLVTKNAGGAATYPKIEAARRLGLPVILVAPPPRPDVPLFHELEAVMAFLAEAAGRQAP